MATQNDINIKIQVDTTQATQSTDNYKKRLKELKDEMTRLQIETDGLSKASEEQRQRFAQLSNEAGKIQDAMSDTAQQVKNLSDDYAGMSAALQGVGAAVGGITAVSGAMSLFGIENEKAAETIKKLTSLMSILQGIQTVEKALNKDSALMTMLRAKAQSTLNKELAKTTTAETAGTAATATFTAAEGAATTGAGALTVGIKAVGAAIKSIPVIGWILAAVSALTTLIALIYQANQAETDGNAAREKHLRQLRDMIDLQARLNSTTSLMIMDLSEYEKILSDINNKGSKEWENAVAMVAKQTGLTTKYIESQSSNISNIVNNYSELTAETERYNSYLQQQQALLNERTEKEKNGEKLTQDYFDNIKAVSDKILESKTKITNLQSQYNGYLAADKKYNDNIAAAEKNREKAKETANNREKEALKELSDLDKFISEQAKQINAETHAGRLANIDDEERQIINLYDTATDQAIKYYGEESEQVKQLYNLRLQALDNLNKKRTEENENEAKQETEKTRKAQDEAAKIEAAKLETQLTALKENSTAYYEKKLEIDRQAEDTEKLELERQLADKLISYETYLSQYDLLTATHAKTRADIEIESAKQTAAEIAEIEKQKLDVADKMISAYSELVNASMEAELEAVGDNEAEQKAIRKRYAKAQFISQIASIGISTAKAIMETWSAYGEIPFAGPVLAGVQTALIAATGIAQTMKAKSAMDKAMKAEKGGILQGASHANGGIKTNVGVELEGGEAVINKRSTAAFAPLLSQINSFNGYGAPLINNAQYTPANGAGMSTDTIQKIVAETVAGVASIPVVVTEHSISEAQRTVNITKERSFI